MRRYILILSLILVVFVSGCTGPESSLPYKNDVITIEDYYVSDKSIYPNSLVTIEFLVKNNGEYAVPRVKIGFSNFPGFDKESFNLICEGTAPVDMDNDGVSETCIFDDTNEFGPIDSLDSRRVLFTTNAMDLDILSTQTFSTSYYVEYDYSGFRKVDIPIIDGVTRNTPLSSYSESSQTYGPIRLDIDMPARGQKIVDDKTIDLYWGVDTQPFRIEFDFTHTGSGSIGSIRDPIIEEGDIRLDLRDSLEIAYLNDDEKRQLKCDFSDNNGYLYSDEDVEVPGKLICNFQSLPFDEPETQATIWVDYVYTYKYTKSERFEINPIG